MKKEKKGISLLAVLLMLSLFPLILAVIIITNISTYLLRSNMERETENKLMMVANNLSSYCMDNQITAINASDYYEYIDSLKEYGIEMGIIADNTPCTTSIKNENDYRIREIELSVDTTGNKEIVGEGYYDKNVMADNAEYYAYIVPIQTSGEVGALAFAAQLKENVNKEIQNVINIFIAIAILLLLVLFVIVFLFGKNLSNKISAITNDIKSLSTGDLSYKKQKQSTVEEMNVLFGSASMMQRDLNNIIGNVKNTSEDIVTGVNEMTALSENSTDRAKQINGYMEVLSASTASLDSNVQNINEQMNEIDSCVSDIAQSMEHLYENTDHILTTNEEAKDSMNIMLGNSAKTVEAINDISAQIKQTNDAIAKIDQAVELILSISQQTNLLSLNASIEAARAGEQGKGFAVVAGEIRALSEQSAKGAVMIKDIAQVITEKSSKSVKLVGNVKEIIEDEQRSISRTSSKFEEHNLETVKSVEEIRYVTEITEKLSRYNQHILESIRQLGTISQENNACNEEVNRNISHIISDIKQINESCEKMNQRADELQNAVSFFKN